MSELWALALHGGAGPLPDGDYSASEAHMQGLLEKGKAMLEAGRTALDTAETMVRELEACGLHVAGRGASPNTDGVYELDASIMDGRARRAGAVAALSGYKHPVTVARQVMEASPNLMLVGSGAAAFADRQGGERVDDPGSYYLNISSRTSQSALSHQHGTVGAVVLDRTGDLAAATSTGGIVGKTPGRVGDTPIIGAGTWADRRVAVSCTGLGEYFIRAHVAADVSARMRYSQVALGQAATDALAPVSQMGGEGGLICIDSQGRIEMVFDTSGMKRGCINSDGRFEVATFR